MIEQNAIQVATQPKHIQETCRQIQDQSLTGDAQPCLRLSGAPFLTGPGMETPYEQEVVQKLGFPGGTCAVGETSYTGNKFG